MNSHRTPTHRKRRIRKKWHVQEYREWAATLSGSFAPVPNERLESRVDEIIAHVETLGVSVTGVFQATGKFDCYIESARSLTPPVLEDVVTWLVAHGATGITSQLVDKWA